MTLVDLSQGMLDASRTLNPECEHIQGDMRTVRLNREFDTVFIHDAILYMTSENDLRKAIETAFIHCRAGGCALFAPDFTKENFKPSSSCGGHDDGIRGMRYLEWNIAPDPEDCEFTTYFTYILREEDGTIRFETDEHTLGIFPRELWLQIIRDAGFEVEAIPDKWEREIFVGKKGKY